jgi:uncharacterized FAD-dependent dehydrogenase
MFTALVLAQMGFKPIVIERGTTVRQRTKDTWGLWRKHVLKAESNVQFGEGGAGDVLRRQAVQPNQRPCAIWGRKVMARVGALWRHPKKFCGPRIRTSAPSNW